MYFPNQPGNYPTKLELHSSISKGINTEETKRGMEMMRAVSLGTFSCGTYIKGTIQAVLIYYVMPNAEPEEAEHDTVI